MRNWNSRKDRQKAREIFRDALRAPENAAVQEDCVNSSELARENFARICEFYLEESKPSDADANIAPIPKDVEFRVFPEDVAKREKMVVLVVRDPAAQPEKTDSKQIWMCTYFPY